jgi:multicomponent Na+:H+ antiporter subunit B
MNTLIFRTIAPLLVVVMLVFSVFITLRGHNDPGGGFIGGLIAASAIAIYGMAAGPQATRKAMRIDPLSIAGAGVLLAGFSGLLSLPFDLPFLTGLWTTLHLGATQVALSTPMFFDIGVYLVVLGTISAVALGLEDSGEEG